MATDTPDGPDTPSQNPPPPRPKAGKIHAIAGGKKKPGSKGGGGPPDPPVRLENPIAKIEAKLDEVIEDLSYRRIDTKADTLGRQRTKKVKIPMDAGRAHAVISAMKLKLELYNQHQVAERQEQQQQQLNELMGEIRRLKQQRGG